MDIKYIWQEEILENPKPNMHIKKIFFRVKIEELLHFWKYLGKYTVAIYVPRHDGFCKIKNNDEPIIQKFKNEKIRKCALQRHYNKLNRIKILCMQVRE